MPSSNSQILLPQPLQSQKPTNPVLPNSLPTVDFDLNDNDDDFQDLPLHPLNRDKPINRSSSRKPFQSEKHGRKPNSESLSKKPRILADIRNQLRKNDDLSESRAGILPEKQNPSFERCDGSIHPADLTFENATIDAYNGRGIMVGNLESSTRMFGGESIGEIDLGFEDFELGTQLNALIGLCTTQSEEKEGGRGSIEGGDFEIENLGEVVEDVVVEERIECPICGTDVAGLEDEMRCVHINECIEKAELQKEAIDPSDDMKGSSGDAVDVAPVLQWLEKLGLSRYAEAFRKEEIDWDTLQWLTEEDLLSVGITALGPRRKMLIALKELRAEGVPVVDAQVEVSTVAVKETSKTGISGNKLITEFFRSSSTVSRRKEPAPTISNPKSGSIDSKTHNKRRGKSRKVGAANHRETPSWSCIPGTPFHVDAFRYLKGDCADWFLTHFHIDHYQGLTRKFSYGKIYCSSITARLVNMRIGIPYDKLHILPLNKKINIKGTGVTCFDANHCPGSVIILFEPPNGKPVLHTGDFRYHEGLASNSVLASCHIHTLILDTTYCNPQYDFPKQEAVIEFVTDSIQAEAFNPRTLFLIGTYTIGKEKLFLEIARTLSKKIYVDAAKLQLLGCLEFPPEDMQWFTSNELESNIHVVPLWTIASFKRMKHISSQYSGSYDLIVAFSPTGWSFGKGKKKSPGRRWQQGTIIRYEVPYSEHSSFSELREFVDLVSPERIIPSVNNDGPESANAMVALLKSHP